MQKKNAKKKSKLRTAENSHELQKKKRKETQRNAKKLKLQNLETQEA